MRELRGEDGDVKRARRLRRVLWGGLSFLVNSASYEPRRQDDPGIGLSGEGVGALEERLDVRGVWNVPDGP